MTLLWCFSCGVISITMTRIIKVAFSWIYKLILLFSAEVIKIWPMHQLLKYTKTFLKGKLFLIIWILHSYFGEWSFALSACCSSLLCEVWFAEKSNKSCLSKKNTVSLLIEVRSSWFASEKRDVRWNQILNMTVYQTLIFLVFICEYIFVICYSLFTY